MTAKKAVVTAKPDKKKTASKKAKVPKGSAEERTFSLLPTQRKANPIDLDEIQPDPGQPRRRVHTRDNLTDILSTLRVVDGCALPINPILLRPAPKDAPAKRRWMIIVGERRYHSGHFAGASSISAEIRTDLSEDEVRDTQIAENIDRQDLTPLELADAIAARWKALGRKAKANEVAFRLGLPSARAVHRYLALAGLCPEVREALLKGTEEGGITERKALAIATLTDHGEQKRALEYVKHQEDRYVARTLEQHFHLRLVGGPVIVGFDVDDATLPGGPCKACPKNTASQRSLWSDSKGDEARCTDRACFHQKIKLTSERRKERAVAAGARTATPEESKKIYPHEFSSSPAYESGVVDLDSECDLVEPAEGEKRSPTWREVLGDGAKPSLVADDKSGRAHELLTVADAAAAALALGKIELAKDLQAQLDDEEGDEAPRRNDTWAAEQKAQAAAAAQALDSIKAAAIERESAGVWRLVCSLLIFYEVDLADGNNCIDAAERRGLPKPEDTEDYGWAAEVLRKWLARPESTEADARALAVELLVMQGGLPHGPRHTDENNAFLLGCRFAGIDFEALVKTQRGAVGLPAEEDEEDDDGPEADAPSAVPSAAVDEREIAQIVAFLDAQLAEEKKRYPNVAGEMTKTFDVIYGWTPSAVTPPFSESAAKLLRLEAKGAAEPLKTRFNTAAKGIEKGAHRKLIAPLAGAAPEPPKAGVCRVCTCTEEQACVPACRWADGSETLCSTCDELCVDIKKRVEARTEGVSRGVLLAQIDTLQEEDLEEPRVRKAIEDLILRGELLDDEGTLRLASKPLDRVQARVLAVCKDKKRTRAQIKAGCKDYLAAEVDQAIDALAAAKRLDIHDGSKSSLTSFIAAVPRPGGMSAAVS